MPAVAYQKHLVECKCILPQYKHHEPPVWHHFVVFSEFNEKGDVIPSFAQCNNCGIIHKVIEIGVSSILKRDDLPSLLTPDEILGNFPEKLQKDIERYGCELPTLQEIAWIFEHQAWGRHVILTKDEVDGIISGKVLLILGTALWKISAFQDGDENE